MRIRTVYKLHKWMGLTIGLFLFVSVVTGFVWISPYPGIMPSRPVEPKALKWDRDFISPQQAAAVIECPLPVKKITLRNILKDAVYEIETMQGSIFLVNACSGKKFQITEETACQLARNDFNPAVPVKAIAMINQHSLAYDHGPLPAYRIIFDNKAATHSYVDANTGNVVLKNNKHGRIRRFFVLLHDLSIISVYTGFNLLRQAPLMIMSLIAMAVILSGYYLALARYRNKKV